jgi:hypothetical protein
VTSYLHIFRLKFCIISLLSDAQYMPHPPRISRTEHTDIVIDYLVTKLMLSVTKKFPAFMEIDSLLMCSLHSDGGLQLYNEPVEANPHSHMVFQQVKL